MGELHSLTDWQVSEASEDAELEDFCCAEPRAGGGEKRQLASKARAMTLVRAEPTAPLAERGPQPSSPLAADAGWQAGCNLGSRVKNWDDALPQPFPLLIPSHAEPTGILGSGDLADARLAWTGGNGSSLGILDIPGTGDGAA